MAKKFSERKSFLVPVFRANYLAFGAVLIVLAAQSLPRRLNHPNFLDFGLIFPPAAFAAVECLDACHALPVRMAELRCNLECERIDPEKNQRYCPGFTPCLIACEAKYPAEAALEQAAKVEKTKCNGVCFTNHFKIDCSDTHYYPPGEDGGGKAAKGVAGRGNNADLALAGKAGLDGTPPVRGLPSSGNAKQAANPAASARSEGVAAAIASAEAATAATIASAGKPAASSVRGSTVPMVGDHEKKPESEVATKPAEEHLWNLKGGLKPQHFDQPPAESVLADVVKASIGEASELTLFQRVTRAYRNTRYWYESR